MQSFLRSTACLALFLQVLFVSAAPDGRPNIVFLMADDQNTLSMGCYGNDEVQTPNLDRLASRGMVFDNHYDTTAICMASRATVLTGMYEYKHGCNFGHGDMLTETWRKSYPVLLREAGYLTAFAGKFGLDLKATPEGRRIGMPEDEFDRWGGSSGQTSYKTKNNKSMAAYAEEYPHSTLSYGAFGRDFIRDAAQSGKPFCLSISFKAPHRPTTPDPQFDHVYAGKSFTKPANFGREHGKHFSGQSKQDRQWPRFYEWGYADNYDNVMATYYQQVYGIDVAVGMIMEALEESGAAGNTVVIYTSDNGFFCGSHGYGSKVLPYQESVRVPTIILDPRHSNSGKQLRSSALTGSIDFAPTMLRLAGVPVPANMDGANLMDLYDDPEAAIHESLALMNLWGKAPTHVLSVLTKDTKYIYWSYAAEGFEPAEELYDLSGDPLELVNEAGNAAYCRVLARMRATYDEYLLRWKAEAVPYNHYQQFARIFDRSLEWQDKEGQVRNYTATK
jgi:arylsulfatase A-like enzyme